MQAKAFALLLAASSAVWAASPAVGDWIGTLKPAEQVELRLLLHVKEENGKLTANFDSLDQGGKGIPIDSISLKDGSFEFDSNGIDGHYEGKLTGAAGAERIHGTWTQRDSSLPLDFERYVEKPKPARTGPPSKPSDIDGKWQGDLQVPGGQTLKVVFHIKSEEDGLAATVDSPDQNAFGIPVTSVKRDANKLELVMKGLGASYKGEINGEKNRVEGTFTQGGSDMALTLLREPEKPKQ